MKNIFQTVAGPKINRTAFNLSHERKMSMKMGKLVPILVEEVLPGDKYKIKAETMIRLAPMISPIMHRVDAYVHFFYVPNRLVWPKNAENDGWEGFITGRDETTVPAYSLSYNVLNEGTLYDYMGLPTHLTQGGIETNMLPFRAYRKIWNDYYRDQHLQDELELDVLANPLLDRPWEKDYFTSSLPYAQMGGEVQMPLDASLSPDYKVISNLKYVNGTNATGTASGNVGALEVAGTPSYLENLEDEQLVEGGIEVNAFRKAIALQKWLERNARAGSRYVEHLLAHWGVKSSDARLDRAEYIGGGKSPIVVSEVLNNTGLDPDNLGNNLPHGSMSGHGINVGQTNQANKYVEEHGYIIGIMSVLPRTAYSQGQPRMYSRQTFDDFYFPEFAHLGEQEVKDQEIYATGVKADDIKTFGYQSRYAEYRYQQSSVHGDFRGNLDFWHMARKFDALPALNEDFIKSDPRTDIFAVDDGSDPLWVTVYNNIIAKRPMPYYATPR